MIRSFTLINLYGSSTTIKADSEASLVGLLQHHLTFDWGKPLEADVQQLAAKLWVGELVHDNELEWVFVPGHFPVSQLNPEYSLTS